MSRRYLAKDPFCSAWANLFNLTTSNKMILRKNINLADTPRKLVISANIYSEQKTRRDLFLKKTSKIFLSSLLISCLILTSLIFIPQESFAVPAWKNGNSKALPPGLAKKFAAYEQNQTIEQLNHLTRAQVAFIIAEGNDDYDSFHDSDEILQDLADAKSIPESYKKAVAFVIKEDLLPSFVKHQANGTLVFQPNKPVSWSDVYWLIKGSSSPSLQPTRSYAGTLCYKNTINSKLWIVLRTSQGLHSAYFDTNNIPQDLTLNSYLTVEVKNYKIIDYTINSSSDIPDDLEDLTLSLAALEDIHVDERVLLQPQLINNSSDNIYLRNMRWRFTIRNDEGNKEWEFTSSSSASLDIPSRNEDTPADLQIPSKYWTPSQSGAYHLVEAQLKIGNDDWQDIAVDSSREKTNLLTTNQSNIEYSTKGFLAYGYNIYAGATLTRSTQNWQGDTSLKISTNGDSPWQGVNVQHKDSVSAENLTFSFYIKAPKGTPLCVKIFDDENNNYPRNHSLNFTASGDWERKSITFKPLQNTEDLSLQIGLNDFNDETIFYIDGLQLEKGNIATSWIPGNTSKNADIIVEP